MSDFFTSVGAGVGRGMTGHIENYAGIYQAREAAKEKAENDKVKAQAKKVDDANKGLNKIDIKGIHPFWEKSHSDDFLRTIDAARQAIKDDPNTGVNEAGKIVNEFKVRHEALVGKSKELNEREKILDQKVNQGQSLSPDEIAWKNAVATGNRDAIKGIKPSIYQTVGYDEQKDTPLIHPSPQPVNVEAGLQTLLAENLASKRVMGKKFFNKSTGQEQYQTTNVIPEETRRQLVEGYSKDHNIQDSVGKELEAQGKIKYGMSKEEIDNAVISEIHKRSKAFVTYGGSDIHVGRDPESTKKKDWEPYGSGSVVHDKYKYTKTEKPLDLPPALGDGKFGEVKEYTIDRTDKGDNPVISISNFKGAIDMRTGKQVDYNPEYKGVDAKGREEGEAGYIPTIETSDLKPMSYVETPNGTFVKFKKPRGSAVGEDGKSFPTPERIILVPLDEVKGDVEGKFDNLDDIKKYLGGGGATVTGSDKQGTQYSRKPSSGGQDHSGSKKSFSVRDYNKKHNTNYSVGELQKKAGDSFEVTE